MKRRVIVLTLSEKFGKKCVAAYDFERERLVRLVSDENGTGIPNHCVSDVNLLDVVEVEVVQACPLEHQTENELIDLRYGVRVVGCIDSFEELSHLANQYPPVFGDTNYKLYDTGNLNHSLEIVAFSGMSFFQAENGKTKVTFRTNGRTHYNYSVTEKRFYGATGTKESGYAIISLPLSDDYTRDGGGYFKYVSAIY